MKIIDRWNEIMGPKDERLAAEANRCAAIGYTILIIGSALCLYYGIMLNQVAETTGHPLLTPLGQSVFPVDTALLIIILASGLISTYLQVRSGTFFPKKSPSTGTIKIYIAVINPALPTVVYCTPTC